MEICYIRQTTSYYTNRRMYYEYDEVSLNSIKDKIVSNLKENYEEFCEVVNKQNNRNKIFKGLIATNLICGGAKNIFASSSVSQKIIKCFDPLLDIISGIGYPVTNATLIVGCLMIITGRKKQGLEWIKWACVGYLGIQFMPFVLRILDMVGAELRGMSFD